jgi:energy-coupling factor transport system ATP-binding protein
MADMIAVKGLSFAYAGSETLALDGLDFSVPAGQFCGLVGANGSGKSTLCAALTGFVPHFYTGEYHGEVSLDGKEIAATSLGLLAGEVGLVFQNPFNQISGARFSVREEIAFGLENLGLPARKIARRCKEVMQLIGLSEVAERSPFELSGGQQQRVAIASILAMQPKVLVLDEPTSQLDPRGSEEVFASLKTLVRRGQTVVMADHKLEWLATFADRVIALDRGHIALDGPAAEVLASPRLLKLGIGRTQYTQAADAVRKKSLIHKKGDLPVTLSEAKAFFK